ncbi:N-acetylmuramoyl-L-alanine amidase [Streptomyces spectabilis]|uniref:N-acetylmuramoyl-L-alanine amidase n=1 Tax=Streptomyces spectabilis TaxID=68270 RepID=A0A516R6K6_STRST|nr:N-acetylmuramoyl-L-alanine amidase [Streptomyces spectabilis]QDQ11281.1 N-acetylmuramoyl-L-alanine amidase [Streptomyces spectabilis]
MSYVGPDSQPPRPPRRFGGGRTLAVTLAVLAPAALAGYLIHDATSGPEDAKPPRTLPSASRSDQNAPSKPTADDPAKSPAADRSGEPKGEPDGKKDSEDNKDNKDDGKPSEKAPSGGRPAPSGPLKGKVVVIDPGHNPGNFRHTAEINRPVNIGTNSKECDTTGTSTNRGYTEARFTLDLAHRLRDQLHRQGATVRLTQDGDRAWGPCVDERARIGNAAHADAVVSLHADGSAVGNHGFHVILPARVRGGAADTTAIVGPSRDLGERIAGKFLSTTKSAPSNYVGDGTGLDVRRDLGGLNLSKVPKVFIECGNMRDPKDEALLTNPNWRQKAARGISDGIGSFLSR